MIIILMNYKLLMVYILENLYNNLIDIFLKLSISFSNVFYELIVYIKMMILELDYFQ